MRGLVEQVARMGEGFCPRRGHGALILEKDYDPTNPGSGRWGRCSTCCCSWKLRTIPTREIVCDIERRVAGQIVRVGHRIWVPADPAGINLDGDLLIEHMWWEAMWKLQEQRNALLST